VTVGGALIVYGMAVGFGGPAGFRRAAWPLRAPRLGAVALVAVAWSVPVAFLLAGLTVALPVGALTADLGQMVGACLGRLRAAYATPAGAGFVTAGQVLTAGILARGGWAVVRVCRRRRDERRRHRLLVRLAAHRAADLPALVLDHPHAVAYSVAGRGQAVVVTRGIVDLLTGPELSAVLAHENAHLAGRHHRWQTAAILVAQALPIVPLLRDAPSRVGRLLEMDADDLAAAHHEPRVIASALVTVAAAGSRAAGTVIRSGAVRSNVTAAAGADAVARVHRLLDPPDGLPRARRVLTRVAVAALTLAPLVLAVAPMAVAVV
jgi:Zn-dependent protease with chaperone function